MLTSQDQYIKREAKSKLTIYIFASIISFLINYLCVNKLDNIATIVSIVFLLFVFIQPIEDYLCYIVLAIPSSRTMELFSVSISVWICVEYLLRRVIKRKITIRKDLAIPLVIYMLYAIQYYVRFNSFMYGFLQPAKMIAVLWFLYSYLLDENSILKDYRKIRIIFYAWMFGIVTALFPVLLTSNAIGRLSALNNDSNLLSVQAVFVLACLSVMYMNKTKLISFTVYLTSILFSLMICLMCGSRNGFLLLSIVLVSTILFNNTGNRIGKNFLIIIGIAAIIGFTISTSFVQSHISSIQRRLSLLEQSGNISNGRFALWEEYIDVFNSNIGLWLFGLGTYTFYGLPQMAHNLFLEDVASYGIVGIVILLFAYYSVMQNAFYQTSSQIIVRKSITRRIYNIIPFLVPIIGGMTLHSLTSLPNTIMLYIGIVLYAISGEERG